MQEKSTKYELAEGGFMSTADAETFSGLKKSKLYLLMASGELPYTHVGKARRIPKRALIELMARNLVMPSE